MPALTWGDTGYQRAEALMYALLECHKYEGIKSWWDISNDDGLHHFRITNVTKELLAKIINGGKPIYESRALAIKKGHIQTAFIQLEHLGILEDMRKIRKGPHARILNLRLKLPSRDPKQVINWLKVQWDTHSNRPSEPPSSTSNTKHIGAQIKYEITWAGSEMRNNRQILKLTFKCEGLLDDLTSETLKKIADKLQHLTEVPDVDIVLPQTHSSF
jgi:hypothetical protein